MDLQTLIYLVVGASFALYIGIAIWARAGSTGEFYAAGRGVPPVMNGMATAADWMSAASFISMAGLIAFTGYDNSTFLMGWTGGYVLLAMLLAPYLRKFGRFTVPEFIGDRYYSQAARIVAVICLIVISVTYVIGQMRGVGVTFSRFLEVPVDTGLYIGSFIVFVYAVLGGMKGITYTQVAQYCVLILAYTVPAVFISLNLTGNPIPAMGLFGDVAATGTPLLEKLDLLVTDLGFRSYTEHHSNTFNMILFTLALMIGTAGLPHVIIRFFTVPKVADARWSAGWALVFIAILYLTAPAVGAMARLNIIATIQDPEAIGAVDGNMLYDERPSWMRTWENTGLLAFAPAFGSDDQRQAVADVLTANENARAVFGVMSESGITDEVVVTAGTTDGDLMDALVAAAGDGRQLAFLDRNGDERVQFYGAGLSDDTAASYGWNGNEMVKFDRDILVLANPEIAQLPNWVIALVAAGGLAAALSTAAGLLLAIASAISHDLLKSVIKPDISESGELWAARLAMTGAILLATYLGLNPPGFAAQVVALAFGLAAATIFPTLMMGIFSKRVNNVGAIAGMLAALIVTLGYVFAYLGVFFISEWKLVAPGTPHLLGISPASFGVIGAAVNFIVAFAVSNATEEPPAEIQELVESVRVPRGAGAAVDH